MIDSVSNTTNAVVALQQKQLSQEINIAVAKKANDIQEQQGQSALKLIESANNTQGIDLHA